MTIDEFIEMDLKEHDDIVITGVISSEHGHRVVDLNGVVSTIDILEDPAIKVWPMDEHDSQLPKGNNGKLWFPLQQIEALTLIREYRRE